MNTKGSALIAAAYLALCAFHTDKKMSGCTADCKDGFMEVRDTLCAESTEKDFAFKGDTLTLPYCVSYPCTGGVTCQKDSTGKPHCTLNYKRLPEETPFYLRKGVYIKLSLSGKQQKHFEAFRQKLFNSIKDTGLRSELWFDLTSLENAIKSNDAVSYMTGITHLEASWKKVE